MTLYHKTDTCHLYQGDCIERMRERAEYSTNLIFCDPPYALGSKVKIMPNGKPDYIKAVDFMDKWEMPTGAYWEDWFKEAYRMLKHGGYCVMYGIDRQLLMFKYYASLAGFAENQSLYWFYISSFPKSANLSKHLDKHQGVKQEVVGQQKITGQCLGKNKGTGLVDTEHKVEWNITKSTSELGKKYDGYKYGVAPLKQTNETIMVFQKPHKTGSCLHDTLAYEAGDTTCLCSALNIEGSLCGISGGRNNGNKANSDGYTCSKIYGKYKATEKVDYNKGRYPAQTYVDPATAKLLDDQSGLNCGQQAAVKGTEPSFNKDVRLYGDYTGQGKASEPRNDVGGCSKILHKCEPDSEGRYPAQTFVNDGAADLIDGQTGITGGSKPKHNADIQRQGIRQDAPSFNSDTCGFDVNKCQSLANYGDAGGGSKVLHKCNYEQGEYDIYQYNPKVSGSERNAGCIPANTHPTCKPISLNTKLLTLFKTPDEQSVFIPFCGSGSEVIGAIQAGYKDWEAVEINPEYCEIAKHRIDYYTKKQPIFEF